MDFTGGNDLEKQVIDDDDDAVNDGEKAPNRSMHSKI